MRAGVRAALQDAGLDPEDTERLVLRALDEDFRYFPHSVKANGGIQLSRTRDRHFANLCLHTSFDAS